MSAGVASMICLNSSACRALPASITDGNSWHGCRCRPTRTASLISAASSRAGCTGAPARPAPRRGRLAESLTNRGTLQARTGRRTTWTTQGDYLLDLSTSHTSCPIRHPRAG
eukprot:7149908-Prymnesium_polylepis.2